MDSPIPNLRNTRIALWQTGALAALCLAVFRSEVLYIYRSALSNPESAHGWALPVLAGILLARRWPAYRKQLTNGSIWGLVLILISILVFMLASWPFNFGYPRLVALVMALAGALLFTSGWRALKLAGPIIVLLLLSLPIGSRHYSRLIILPETHTLRLAQMLLDLLPGVFIQLNGPDLSYIGSRGSGSIALGEPHRGASLFMAYAAIGVFVTFLQYRPAWQIAVVAMVAAPALLISNLFRVLIYGLVTIYGNLSPLNPMPRYFSIVLSLLGAYGIFCLALWILNKIVQPTQSDSTLASA